jgi:arylsulfatase A-like enzyme
MKNILLLSILLSGYLLTAYGSENIRPSDVEISEREKAGIEEPFNVVFILSDDHRYDFMGFMDKVPYLETLKGIDRSIGEVLDYLEANDLIENTAVFYMGDNGFSFGEHGLIDKRQAYEESIRVPLLVYAPSMIKDGSKIDRMVQNIDIASTILELAGLQKTNAMDGASFVPMLRGEEMPDWRKRIYYEYFWERPFPQTPTIHAVRTDTFKYIRYYGVWDINELYNLQQDPDESNNLIRNEEYRKLSGQLNEDIFDWLQRTNGMKIPLIPDQGARFDHKYQNTY